ncbi:hypothetical protein [Sphingomonas jatrophae]|uniref:Uncharacterized protein n=1 Tax=Sphingomonas jatrophae TaxID=1166337 RepID=A0A1I6JYN8_9SPHN|nr:hypothetical protein [Sphingomonas jatrophae]SFR84074.1 hypothetical protein SAMN05192580_1089 [Sphingomonas jatrophae]
MSNTSEFGRILLSAIGALVASATCLVGAAGPARANPAVSVAKVVVSAPATTGLVGAVRY